ncbi:glutathione S-transferase theta-1-like [Hyperolius riggenbachi]|uniref:glutathione S-transferase theta-1-like n=1 Tax=Hyperolius riggenbachi TaxID=752182 RepID=UPI0035A37A89
MPDLTLYLDLLSQPCRSVYIFAKANNIPFNHHEMWLFKGDQLSEEFAKVNPIRKIPALKDGDFTLAESTAMLLYMAEKYKMPDHWYPSDLQKRARVVEYLSWQDANTHFRGSKLFWLKVMAPFLLGHELESKKVDAALAEFNTTMTNVEDHFLRDKPFIAGDKISIADLVAIVEIMQAVGAGVAVFESRPKLAAWKQRVVEAIGEEIFREAHEKILNVKDEQKNTTLPPAAKARFKIRLDFWSNN